MWIVRLALRRPYSVATFCLVMLLMGILSISKMSVDIFPEINIPVVVVVWNYNGLSAEDMERRIVLPCERAFSTSVSGITSVESDSISGNGIIRVYFEPGTDLGAAIAEVTSTAMTVSRIMPPGIQPPTILRFNASNVPVAQLTLKSDSLSEQQLYDYGLNFLRMKLFTIKGLAAPAPYGGAQRQVNVDLDLTKLAANGLSPAEVVNAINQSNVIVPAGQARIGSREFDVRLNGSPTEAPDFNSIPLKIVNGAPVLLGEVAHVYDGFAVQQNIVRVDGRRATYLAILKKEDASTIAVVDATRDLLPAIKAAAPEGLELKLDMDQSVFVRAAVKGVLREALISAGLVSLMVLVFLGSWRSMIIVCTSIPIAILCSVVGLFLTGQTLNIMTLGGLALAIGMLVDDATVEVENIHRNRALKKDKPLTVAILDGANQIAVPALAATLTICIVFFPVVLLTGPAKYLFVPLALAVVFAMLASYLLSRTLVPATARLLMEKEPIEGEEDKEEQDANGKPKKVGRLARAWKKFNHWREERFDKLRESYGRALETVLRRPVFVLSCVGLVVAATGILPWLIGLDFFPSVDAGQMRIHYRAPVGTRLEDTEVDVGRVEDKIKSIVGDDLDVITDTIGVPTSYNLGFVQSDSIGGQDADLFIGLKEKHKATDDYVRRIREEIPNEFPGSSMYFQPASIVERVLDFGVAAPIDVQVASQDSAGAMEVAKKILAKVRRVPGVADARITQVYAHPAIAVNVDRQRAAHLGLSERDVATSLLTSLSSSSLLSPSFWLNPENMVSYFVAVQTPLVRIESMGDLLGTPLGAPSGQITPSNSGASTGPATITGGGGQAPTPLVASTGTAPATNATVSEASYVGAVAEAHPDSDRALVSHYNVQPVVDVECNVDQRDLGGVSGDIQKIVDAAKKEKLPKGTTIDVRGQSESMRTSFKALGLGVIGAIALVYLLMVVLFQSWLDPLVILVAVPGAGVGILWMLAITGTTLNVESLMGSIMAVGIAVSNSILLVSFANDWRTKKGKKGRDEAGASKESPSSGGKETGEGAEHAPSTSESRIAITAASIAASEKGAASPAAKPLAPEGGPAWESVTTSPWATDEKAVDPKAATTGDTGGRPSEGGGDTEGAKEEAHQAALEAGKTRLRPVIMTALAMILGMLPMALALGEGGEQNAPLGRAVIGGLLVATFFTLFVVPLIYSRLRTKPPRKDELEKRFKKESRGTESEKTDDDEQEDGEEHDHGERASHRAPRPSRTAEAT